MSDREAMKLALEALEAVMPFSTTQRGLKIKAVEALRTHLDAPRPEPVAFDFQKAFRLAFNLGQNYGIDAESDSRAAHKRADKYRQEFDVLCADALAHAALAAPSLAVTVDPRLTTDEAAAISSALAAPQPEPTHPGYILGSHWLETAYSRICAGEAEADVLKDCGWERVTDADALRRDAERLNWVRVELFRPIWDGATNKPCEWHLRDDYKHTIQRMQGNNFRAAIDAAMEPATEPAIREKGEVPR